MSIQNYERVGKMLDYLNKKERVEVDEIIANFVPSIYDLNIVFNKVLKGEYFNTRIDMQSKELKGAIRKAYELKHKENFNSTMIYRYLKENSNAKHKI